MADCFPYNTQHSRFRNHVLYSRRFRHRRSKSHIELLYAISRHNMGNPVVQGSYLRIFAYSLHVYGEIPRSMAKNWPNHDARCLEYLLFCDSHYKSQHINLINTTMTTDTQKLEKIIKEQSKQIESLKKALSGIQRQMTLIGKKTDRTYESSRKNANDINNITGILRRNG